jgi:hypothetical protein
MRASPVLFAIFLATSLTACAGGAKDFEADFAAAKANVATLEGGAFDHAVGQRLTTPELQAVAMECIADNPADRTRYRGVMAFEDPRGYRVRFEVDDALARCFIGVYEDRNLPEPPTRPYLLPIEIGEGAQ